MNAFVHQGNVRNRVDELVRLVCGCVANAQDAGASLQVCTGNVGITMCPHAVLALRPDCANLHPVAATPPTPEDGVAAMASPAMYGLLCTVFEWFRVAIDGNWSVGPYDMRRWDFLNAVAPIPYVAARDSKLPQYCMCSRTGFRRWTPTAMLDRIKTHYGASDDVIRCLGVLVK